MATTHGAVKRNSEFCSSDEDCPPGYECVDSICLPVSAGGDRTDWKQLLKTEMSRTSNPKQCKFR